MFDLDTIIIIGIIIICAYLVFKLIRGMTVNIYRKTEKKKLDPTSTGERLKVYLIQAAKLNPKTAKTLVLERTKYNEGGRIGRIVGYITDKDVTTFIIKKRLFGAKFLLYVPVDKHTSLHQKNVICNGVSISSAGGYLWVIPVEKEEAASTFDITARAFERDLKRMMTMDIPQIEIEQIYQGITGFNRDRSFYDEDEELEEPSMSLEGDLYD
jgi:hypothetical protein